MRQMAGCNKDCNMTNAAGMAHDGSIDGDVRF